MPFNWPISQPVLAGFCERHHITRLALFGSALRDDFGPESDVDLLVEFDPAHVPGLIRFAGMAQEMSELVSRRVDMRTAADLSRYFRDQVVQSAIVKYAA